MKVFTRFFVILLVTGTISANAQITLVHSFPHDPIYNTPENLQCVYLKYSGFKFVYVHTDTIGFYNINLSLYKEAIFPVSWASNFFTIEAISEGLFDNDSLHIDYLVESSDSVVIYKDNGNVVFRNDTAANFGATPSAMGESVFYDIIATDSGTFMELISNGINTTNILYKLPGSLPCIPGCVGNSYAGMSPINKSTNMAMNIYPNPSISYTNIYYTLPVGTNQGQLILYDLAGRILKEYTITSAVDHLRLTTSDIAAGTYFYQLSINGNAIATRKIVVIK